MKKRILFNFLIFLFIFIGIFAISFICNRNVSEEVIVNIEDNENIKLTKRFIQNEKSNYLKEVIIKATIEPRIVVDKSVEWSMSWSDSNFEENINDYILADFTTTSLEINICFKRSFPKTLILTCRSVKDRSVYAICTFDCYERVSNIKLISQNARFDNYNEEAPLNIDNENRIIDVEEKNHLLLRDYNISLYNALDIETVGTVRPEYNCYIKINISDTLKELLETKFLVENNDYIFEDDNFIDLETIFCKIIEGFSDMLEYNFEDLINILNQTDYWFDVKIEYMGFDNWEFLNEIDSYQVTYQMKGFTVDHYYKVTGLSLNESNMII